VVESWPTLSGKLRYDVKLDGTSGVMGLMMSRMPPEQLLGGLFEKGWAKRWNEIAIVLSQTIGEKDDT